MGALAHVGSALHKPLDHILGSVAGVRIIRVLALHGGWLSAGSIARRAGLHRSGVAKTLDQLVGMDIVEREGDGRAILYRYAARHPLADSLAQLFQREEGRLAGLTQDLRQAVLSRESRPEAIWHFGSVARQEDSPDSDFDVALVWSDGDGFFRQTDLLMDDFDRIGTKWAVKLSVIDLTVADVRKMAQADTPFWRNLLRDWRMIAGRSPQEMAHG
jgi:DNA-binding transcriptional ArsR family regulator